MFFFSVSRKWTTSLSARLSPTSHVSLVISQFTRTERKSDPPNQVQIDGAGPALKITYSRKAIHYEKCLPQNHNHFFVP